VGGEKLWMFSVRKYGETQVVSPLKREEKKKDIKTVRKMGGKDEVQSQVDRK